MGEICKCLELRTRDKPSMWGYMLEVGFLGHFGSSSENQNSRSVDNGGLTGFRREQDSVGELFRGHSCYMLVKNLFAVCLSSGKLSKA